MTEIVPSFNRIGRHLEHELLRIRENQSFAHLCHYY